MISMSSPKALNYRRHCSTCKGKKVDVIETGYYNCATCWMDKDGKVVKQRRRKYG